MNSHITGNRFTNPSEIYLIPPLILSHLSGLAAPPHRNNQYIVELLEPHILTDLINRKTMAIPQHDPQKSNLPKRKDFIGAIAWLKAVQEQMGSRVIFAPNEALICRASLKHSEDIIIEAERVLKEFLSHRCIRTNLKNWHKLLLIILLYRKGIYEFTLQLG